MLNNIMWSNLTQFGEVCKKVNLNYGIRGYPKSIRTLGYVFKHDDGSFTSRTYKGKRLEGFMCIKRAKEWVVKNG